MEVVAFLGIGVGDVVGLFGFNFVAVGVVLVFMFV